MEEFLDLVPKLSLKEMALQRVAINMWSDSYILDYIKNFEFESLSYISSSYERNQIVSRVKNKVSKLALPESLIERLMHLVMPVGREILRWKLFHKKFFHCDMDVEILKKVCWTRIGAVDYRKTVEELLSLKKLDVHSHFRLACLYCLEDRILELWKLPVIHKIRYGLRKPQDVDFLIYYWCKVLEEQGKKRRPSNYVRNRRVQVSKACLDRYWISLPKVRIGLPRHDLHLWDGKALSLQELFEYSALKGNKAAAEYFFQKFNFSSVEDRDEALYKALCVTIGRNTPCKLRIFEHDVFWYLLSSMTHEKQKLILKIYPDTCLLFFLGWPWQDFFLDIPDRIWEFVSEDRYDLLLDRIYRHISFEGQYFPGLIQNFFRRSPNDFKKHFIDNECQYAHPLFFQLFIKFKDAETIKSVLESLDSGDRMRLLSDQCFFRFFKHLLYQHKRSLVDMCLGEAVLSKEERKIVKEAYMKFYTKEEKMCHIFKWLDETSESTNKIRCLKRKSLSSNAEKNVSTKKLKRH